LGRPDTLLISFVTLHHIDQEEEAVRQVVKREGSKRRGEIGATRTFKLHMNLSKLLEIK